jgi:eukaryotic-like serine/threonine-protein kinase
MAFSAGDRLGPYEIIALIGAGGMGQVYRARDTRLGRDVALKVSAQQFSERFEREARAIAALNHPNICTLYDVGPDYLVMEFVEGEAPKGPLPLDEALGIARQIAEALDAAHEKNITHRDLKPANIKIKPDGTVKVLDFGLAKVGRASPSGNPNAENSPTLTMGMTEAGMILGTAAYMSPEQARGKENVDKRADIWSFGVVLYELLTGKRLFQGEDMGEILASVIKETPNLEEVPDPVRPLIERCLAKDPKKRLRDIGDVWQLLQETPRKQTTAPPRSRIPWAVAGLFLIVALVVSFTHFRESPSEPPVFAYTIPPPENATVHSFAISPDGRSVAIAASVAGKFSLWVRALDSLQTRALAGTEGSQNPFWSPDSRYIGFTAAGKLKKIATSGGPPQALADVNGSGATWNRDGVIVYRAPGGGLWRVAAAGGSPAPVITGKLVPSDPFFLPDGRRFLYTISNGPDDQRGVYVSSLDSRQARRLLPDSSVAVYAPPPAGSANGHVVFVREGTLMAQPVDPASLQPAGDLMPVAQQLTANQTAAPFSVSGNGTLLYRTDSAAKAELVWLDRSGKELGSVGEPGPLYDFSLSPDDTRVIISRANSRYSDLWMQDLQRGAASRFTFHASSRNSRPLWSLDGMRVVFSSTRTGRTDLYQKPAGGAAQEQALLTTADSAKYAMDWSRDGKVLLYQEAGRQKTTVLALPLGGGKPIPVLQSDFNEGNPQLSPDNRWLAYVSDESGRNEVYVQPFLLDGKPAAAKWQISTAGGTDPRWRRDGRELLYLAADQKLMSVTLKAAAGSDFAFDAPQALFEAPPLGTSIGTGQFRYAVTGDGKRFLFMADVKGTVQPPLTVITNWQATLACLAKRSCAPQL